MNPFFALLQHDPHRAKAQVLGDAAISGWVKDAIQQLDRRDPVDVLHDLDLLLNLYEALCDRHMELTPAPRHRLRSLTEDAVQVADTDQPASFDQLPGEIEIGGTLDRLLVPEFLTIISEASVGLGWETELFAPMDEPDLLRALDDHHHLHFYNSFALEGEFPSLEDWLVSHQIGFTRRSSGNSSYRAERTQFRKGLTAPISVALDPQGQELIDRQALTRVLRYLKEGQLDEALTLLEMTLGPTLAALPPFRIAHTLQEHPPFHAGLDDHRR
ncbi:MAG: hypothetical protein KGS09_20175 [Nitrospirae bacterium]|nr:hypothetical protein [Nitrospirota bacterium]MDE3041642.1 hypothetical protein [Nitrospirota bacterium]